MTFKNKTQYKAISRRIHDYLVPSLNTGAKCISPSHLCETVSRLKKNLITPYQTEQYPQFSPPLPLMPQWNVWDIKPASALEAISKEFADTELFRVAVSSAQWEKERKFIYVSRSRTTGGAYLVLAPTLSQLRSWLWRPANPAVRSPTEDSPGLGFGQMKREANRDRETFGGAGGGEAMAVTKAAGGRRGERWTSGRWKRSRRWRRYGRKANERVVPWKELVQNPGNPIRGPRDTGHPATNWNSSVAAEARLSIIETWPDRQKIQKARGKSEGRADEGGEKGKGCAVSRSYSFPLVRAEVEIFQGYITRLLAHTCKILNFNLPTYRAKLWGLPKKYSSKGKTNKETKCRYMLKYFQTIISRL